MLEVSQQGTKFILHCSKLKDGERFASQSFNFTALGESVYPTWDGPAGGGSKQDRKREILAELRARPTVKFSARQLSEATGISQSYTITLLSELTKTGDINRTSQDESKQSSNRNPWLYGIAE